METNECQFDSTMKHFFRIPLVMMVTSLLLSVGTIAYAQQFPTVEKNSDGSYNQTVILETFKNYLETAQDLPTQSEDNPRFVRSFFDNLPNSDDYGIVIRIGDEDTREMTDNEAEKLSQDCITLLEEKQAQIAKEKAETTPKQEETRLLSYKHKQLIMKIGIPSITVLIILLIVILVLRSKKKNKKSLTNDNLSPYSTPANSSNNSGTSDVIIRRKTSSVLHKQCLDDVVNNGNYLAINCTDFCNDTAVKTMYIKNTCIIDIYNMYADDLRNPDNPKEDGCMVLGRWVHDEKLDEYAISLEEVVLPGDDAVFAEYELDFGGKIKVKVNEKLRKLRRETNLQYDMTCWVHSHPGLGVFFSNTDCNLHLQHKHSSHPKFLTAIVIDILTPQQELGVFTFKHDMSINAKADLKQFYSLEEWYKWAVESKRTSAVYEEHYNTLENAKLRNNSCYNIQLSNSPIIDIDLIATSQSRNDFYFVHGFSIQQAEQTTNVAVKIKDTDTLIDNELIGCFMVVTHRSYPTIKKIVANYLDKIKFVLVYSIADGMLTSIPVIANDLCSDESYYGEQPLEELKIWTRRKR